MVANLEMLLRHVVDITILLFEFMGVIVILSLIHILSLFFQKFLYLILHLNGRMVITHRYLHLISMLLYSVIFQSGNFSGFSVIVTRFLKFFSSGQLFLKKICNSVKT